MHLTDEERLNDETFFLITGEQAPFSSAEEVYRLSMQRRHYFVKKLSETYQKQREEMEKNRR